MVFVDAADLVKSRGSVHDVVRVGQKASEDKASTTEHSRLASFKPKVWMDSIMR